MSHASRRLQPGLVKVRADLARQLALVDSRGLPSHALEAIADAHHALTVAIARLDQVDVETRRTRLDETEVQARRAVLTERGRGRR